LSGRGGWPHITTFISLRYDIGVTPPGTSISKGITSNIKPEHMGKFIIGTGKGHLGKHGGHPHEFKEIPWLW